MARLCHLLYDRRLILHHNPGPPSIPASLRSACLIHLACLKICLFFKKPTGHPCRWHLARRSTSPRGCRSTYRARAASSCRRVRSSRCRDKSGTRPGSSHYTSPPRCRPPSRGTCWARAGAAGTRRLNGKGNGTEHGDRETMGRVTGHGDREEHGRHGGSQGASRSGWHPTAERNGGRN